MPKISVLMPVYNGEKYLKQALDSILSQTYKDFELIVVNDASKDGTRAILESYAVKDNRVKIIDNEVNSGVAVSLNNAVKASGGEFLARMDADDISLSQRLELQYNYLLSMTDIDVLGTSAEFFTPDGSRTVSPPSSTNAVKAELMFGNCICHPSVMMRRRIIPDNYELYNPSYNGAEDYELWCRLSEKCVLANLPDVLLRYRIHPGQVTASKKTAVNALIMTFRTDYAKRVFPYLTDDEIKLYTRICVNDYGMSDKSLSLLDKLAKNPLPEFEKREYERVIAERAADIILKDSGSKRSKLKLLRVCKSIAFPIKLRAALILCIYGVKK